MRYGVINSMITPTHNSTNMFSAIPDVIDTLKPADVELVYPEELVPEYVYVPLE